MVSLGIIAVITGVILLNQSYYTDSASLSNVADEIALRVSEAQAYGVAVKQLTPGSSDFSIAYGVSVSILSSGSPTSYIIFADRNANKIYDGTWACDTGGSSECLEKITLPNGNYVDSLCNIKTSGPVVCNNVRRVDITFLRPNPEASMVFFNTAGQTYVPSSIAGEQIGLKSPTGLLRYVSVYLSGQVSVQNQ